MYWKLWKLFKKDPIKDRQFPPQYPSITTTDIPIGSALLFLRKGGNKLTQSFGGKVSGFPYEPYFHAATVVDDHRFINVGITTAVKKLTDINQSTTRVDVVTYPLLTATQKQIIVDYVYNFTGRFYDWKGYLRPATKHIIILKHLIKASTKNPFCSELHAEAHAAANHVVSDFDASDTKPWDLQTWAVKNLLLGKAQLYTWYVGPDFGK